MLIVKVPSDLAGKSADADPQNELVEYIAQELDNEGQVHPIAYSPTDPYFRVAVDSGTVHPSKKGPDLREALKTGDKLKVQYVLVVSVWAYGSGVMAVATLYEKGGAIWRDPAPNDPAYQAALHDEQIADRNAKRHKQSLPKVSIVNARQLMIGNTSDDVDNEFTSLAKMWVQSIANGPLTSLPGHPRVAPVKVDKGQAPPSVVVPPPPKPDDGDVVANALKLLANHQDDQAITALRDAVDAKPLDPARRRALVDALSETGHPLVAATEARRAAALMPDKVEFRVLAARNYLQAGQPDDAMSDLKEAVALDPNGPETRLLLGEIDLYKLKLDDAMTQFDFVLGKNPNGNAYYDRALTKCLKGDENGLSQDFSSAKTSGFVTDPASDAARYPEIEMLFEGSEEDLGTRSRSILQRAHVSGNDLAVGQELQSLDDKVSAEIDFLALFTVPDTNKHSSGERLLALKLLKQCYEDLEDYIKTPDDDLYADATITLGEGLKNLDLVKADYSGEMQKG